tara:strand:+ start:223 stop:549 length:327 start_codon:yes stop_codon:yes gene_type:complete
VCGTEWSAGKDAPTAEESASLGEMPFDPSQSEKWDLDGAVPLEIPRGSLVIIHAGLVHYSEANTSPKPRHAYSIHGTSIALILIFSDGIVIVLLSPPTCAQNTTLTNN